MDTPHQKKEETKALHRPSSFTIWFWWVLANTIAGTIAWAISAGAGWFTMGIGLCIAPLIVGVILGTIQWLVIQPILLNSRRYWDVLDGPLYNMVEWPLITILGAVAGSLTFLMTFASVGMVGASGYVLLLPPFFTGGAVFGAFQWWVLKRMSQNAIWWISTNALGIGFGALVGDIVTRVMRGSVLQGWPGSDYVLMPISYVQLVVGGGVSTIVFSIITGFALVWLLRDNSSRSIEEHRNL
jgi:hypothetical protein